MTSTYNVLKDLVADPLAIREYAVDLTTAIEIGDLCFLDTDDVKPASATGLWTGSLAGTRGKLAEKFVGVAQSAHAANDPLITKVRVASRAVVRMPLATATTFEIGDHVCGAQDGSNSYLLSQQVNKVTGTNPTTGNPNETMAIGRVSKREPVSVSIVEFEIMGRGVAGGGVRAFLTS